MNPQKKTDADYRAEILDEARQIVLKDRNSAYGKPEDNFQRIATLWNAFLIVRPRTPLTPLDVAHMMLLMKMARLVYNPTHKDSWVDTAGYAACGAGIALTSPMSDNNTNNENV